MIQVLSICYHILGLILADVAISLLRVQAYLFALFVLIGKTDAV